MSRQTLVSRGTWGGSVHLFFELRYFLDPAFMSYLSYSLSASLLCFVRRLVEKMLAPLGLRPDIVVAWEASRTANVFFQGMPDWLRKVTTFNGRPANVNPGHADNPIERLRATARPEDFVVFKLDIDNNGLEKTMVTQLLEDPTLGGLVDYFFWEHHHGMHEMGQYWGGGEDTTEQSFHLFRRLREAGLLAHVWT